MYINENVCTNVSSIAPDDVYFFLIWSMFAFSEPPVARFNSRRKSVFAETYDPEEDEEDGDAASAVHPKSDEQRARLADAVRSILLFRALDTQQMRDVLDAMFEKKVEPDDYIIKQGDDGDNFYVIER